MKHLLLSLTVLLSTSLYGQIGPTGQGTVNGYYIGPHGIYTNASLSGANLSGANLSYADLDGADLSSADLSDANLSYANLYGADLSGANLSEANLSNTILYGADLSGADLEGAALNNANLIGANFSGADLRQADLDNAEIELTNFNGALSNAIIDAQRNALRASYGEFVSSNLTTLNNQLTKNENVNLVSGTIKDFKVISESENDFAIPPIVEVLMSVTVNKGKLVSFAKAIGDNVEIQGSLFGAEIRQQEINKNNEAVAMDHLAKKAETMSAFFDYEISVESPKRSPVNEDDYFIYSSLSLTTNQNYRNLTSTVLDTISQVAMKPSEVEKYDELGTPYYGLVIWDIDRVKPPKRNSFEDKRCDSATVLEVSARYCSYKGEMEVFFMRTKESFLAFEKIRQQIEKSIVRYEVSRKTRTDSRLLYPFRFQRGGERPFKNLMYKQGVGNHNVIFSQQSNNWYGVDGDSEMLREWVVQRAMEIDKENINVECSGKPFDGEESNRVIDICYKDTEFSSNAKDLERMYGYIRSSPRELMYMGYFKSGFFGTDFIKSSKGTTDESIREKRNTGTVSTSSTMQPVFAYGFDKEDNGSPRPGATFESLQKFGVFISLPDNFKFSTLVFEDLIKKEQLSTITGYVVDPDKPTKR